MMHIRSSRALHVQGISPRAVQVCLYHARNTTRSASTTSTMPEKSRTTRAVEIPKTNPTTPRSTLNNLPLSTVLRSYLIMTLSSSPFLLSTTTSILRLMLSANSPVFSPDRNPVIRWLLKRTFYAQFCAGEDKREVQRCIEGMHKIGYYGLILEYAREILEDGEGSQADVEVWREGLLETVKMVKEGDFIGLKWSGMGGEALAALKADQPPSASVAKAMTDLCDAAAAKGVMLLPAAEPQNAQAAVDAWTLQYARKYNTKPGHAVLYNTYQCYLKSTPATLSRHLALAEKEGFTLGIKLVRGAYLGTERRELIWDTREETDHTYNSIAGAILQKKYTGMLKAPSDQKGQSAKFPDVSVVLATHNLESVQRARKVRDAQKANGEELVKLSYAQLQGMADEVSCALVDAQTEAAKKGNEAVDAPKVFKCVTWGSTGDCLHYLLRRAAENKDAMSRTEMTGRVMGGELRRRFRATFGLA